MSSHTRLEHVDHLKRAALLNREGNIPKGSCFDLTKAWQNPVGTPLSNCVSYSVNFRSRFILGDPRKSQAHSPNQPTNQPTNPPKQPTNQPTSQHLPPTPPPQATSASLATGRERNARQVLRCRTAWGEGLPLHKSSVK